MSRTKSGDFVNFLHTAVLFSNFSHFWLLKKKTPSNEIKSVLSNIETYSEGNEQKFKFDKITLFYVSNFPGDFTIEEVETPLDLMLLQSLLLAP